MKDTFPAGCLPSLWRSRERQRLTLLSLQVPKLRLEQLLDDVLSSAFHSINCFFLAASRTEYLYVKTGMPKEQYVKITQYWKTVGEKYLVRSTQGRSECQWRRGFPKLLLCENNLAFNELTAYRLIFNMFTHKYLFCIDLFLEFTTKKKKKKEAVL